ncbi:MAG: molecular chaperone TorD family protein [Pseudomonadota bacterium]
MTASSVERAPVVAESRSELPERLAKAALILARLFGSDEPMNREEAEEALRLFVELEIAENAGIIPEPARFADTWNEEKDGFIGPASALRLEESIYKPWTLDPSHPLSGQKGHAWGDPAVHMTEVLGGFGLSVDPADRGAPDHLAVILEFLAFLITNRPAAEVSSFVRDHLDWLGDLRNSAQQRGVGNMIPLLTMIGENLVRRLTAGSEDLR